MKYILLSALLFVLWVPMVHAEEQVLPGDLIKGSGSAVYYFYGNRYAFPNEAVYFSWYADFLKVKTVSDEFLASVPLVANVRFKPGSVMVKVLSDPKVYFVSEGNTLQWVETEKVARDLYGDQWAKNVRDVSDALFVDYRVGDVLPKGSDFYRQITVSKYPAIIRAVRDTIPATPKPYETFLHPSGATEVTTTSTDGYLAVFEQPPAVLAQFFKDAVGPGFFLAYNESATTTLFGAIQATTTQLNFVQSAVFDRHRSVNIIVSNLFSATATAVEFHDVTFPARYPAYPRALTQNYAYSPRLLYHQSVTSDSASAIRAWFLANAQTRDLRFVHEQTDESLKEFGQSRTTLHFQSTTGPSWVVVKLLEVRPSILKPIIDAVGTSIAVEASGF